MSIPYGGFKWLRNVDGFDVTVIGKNNRIGYILKVDLEYPNNLHELHNDYTLAPDKIVVSYGQIIVKKLQTNMG